MGEHSLDPVDRAQQDQLDRLEAHADSNRLTDNVQWAAIVIVALLAAAYVGIVLGGAINSQGTTIRTLSERCGK